MKTGLTLCAALAGVTLCAHFAHAESAAFIQQVPQSLSDGRLESEIVIRTPTEAGPSDSPLNLDFRLTNTPQPGVVGGNTSTIRQNGADNRANVDIRGEGNTTSQVQRGNDNDSDIIIDDGYGNSVSVEQRGDSHTSLVDLSGTDGQVIEHIQHGSGKSAVTVRRGQPTNGPIRIEQR